MAGRHSLLDSDLWSVARYKFLLFVRSSYILGFYFFIYYQRF